MSSLLYLLSYNPIYSTDKGFAPLFTGHEPIMLLLHQSAYIASKGFEPSNVMMKTLCLRPLDYKAIYIILKWWYILLL